MSCDTLFKSFCKPLVESIDWPLRSFKDKWCSYILDIIGQSAELGVIRANEAPLMLILSVIEHPFDMLLRAMLLEVYLQASY